MSVLRKSGAPVNVGDDATAQALRSVFAVSKSPRIGSAMRRTAEQRALRRKVSVEWLSLLAAAVLLAACASSGVAAPAGGIGDKGSVPSGSSTGADRSGVDRLTETVTYSEGQERFDPLPASYRPKITAKQAFAAFAAEDDPRSLGTDEKPTVLLASYTNFITGKHATFVTGTMDPVAAAKSDEASKPWWVGVPVWYIRYLHVPMSSSGGGAARGETRAPPQMVVQEMVIPVSAETGKVLMWENTQADRTPTSYPPPTGNGDTRKSAGGTN